MRRGVLLGVWLVGAAVPLLAQVPAQPPPKPAVKSAPKPAAPKPAAAKPVPVPAGQRCTFQIDNVDRQGAVNETPTGTNYFAGGNSIRAGRQAHCTESRNQQLTTTLVYLRYRRQSGDRG